MKITKPVLAGIIAIILVLAIILFLYFGNKNGTIGIQNITNETIKENLTAQNQIVPSSRGSVVPSCTEKSMEWCLALNDKSMDGCKLMRYDNLSKNCYMFKATVMAVQQKNKANCDLAPGIGKNFCLILYGNTPESECAVLNGEIGWDINDCVKYFKTGNSTRMDFSDYYFLKAISENNESLCDNIPDTENQENSTISQFFTSKTSCKQLLNKNYTADCSLVIDYCKGK